MEEEANALMGSYYRRVILFCICIYADTKLRVCVYNLKIFEIVKLRRFAE